MATKFNIINHIPEYKEDERCERCDSYGAAEFQTEQLCKQCVQEDVFEEMNLIQD